MLKKQFSSNRVSQKIVSHIKQLILENKLKQGDQLPPEPELAEGFAVSRTTVREALTILEAQGLIERRKSKGTVIKQFNTYQLLDAFCFEPKSDKDLFLDFLESRKLIESHVVELAIKRAEPKDLKIIEISIKEMENDIISGKNGCESDIMFHQSLAACTKNQVLYNIVRSIGEMLRESRKKSLEVPGRLQECLKEHKQIFNEIKNKDVDKAKKLMVNHLEKVYQLTENIF